MVLDGCVLRGHVGYIGLGPWIEVSYYHPHKSCCSGYHYYCARHRVYYHTYWQHSCR